MFHNLDNDVNYPHLNYSTHNIILGTNVKYMIINKEAHL